MLRINCQSEYMGWVDILPSKSVLHRKLIVSAFSNSNETYTLERPCDDVKVTAKVLSIILKDFITFKITTNKKKIEVLTFKSKPFYYSDYLELKNKKSTDETNEETPVVIDMKESGSSFRFLLPIIGILGVKAIIKTEGKLSSRPHGEIISILKKNGYEVIQKNDQFVTSGTFILPDEIAVDISISSQFTSGIALSSVIKRQSILIKLLGKPASLDYLFLTFKEIQDSQCEIREHKGENIFVLKYLPQVSKDQEYVNEDLEIDWSSAAQFLALGLFSYIPIGIKCPNKHSAQSDAIIVNLLIKMNGVLFYHINEEEGLNTKEGSLLSYNPLTFREAPLKALEYDCIKIPDLVPLLASLCAHANGISKLHNVKNLMYKESNRLEETMKMLTLGGVKSIYDTDTDTLIIYGKEFRHSKGGMVIVTDHRMVMPYIITFLNRDAYLDIHNIKCLNKSFPNFIENLFRITQGVRHAN